MSFIDYDTVSIRASTPHAPKESQKPKTETITKPEVKQDNTQQSVVNPKETVDVQADISNEKTTSVSEPEIPASVVPEEQVIEPMAKPKPATKPVKHKARTKKASENGVCLRNFPMSLVLEAKRLFPSASSQPDAVAALLAVKTGIVDGLPEKVQKLVSDYNSTDEEVQSLKNIDRRLSHLEDKSRDMERLLQELEVACMYSIFDYLGYRKTEVPVSPRDVEFMENGMRDIIYRMREQAAEFVKDEKLKNGRPIR